jgi:hypothetical protein
MPSGAILTKAGAILPNRTATPGEELHQIAPNCGCAKKSKGRKPGWKKSILPLSFCPHLLACKVAEAPPLVSESTAAARHCHLSRLSYAGPSQVVRDIESNLRQFNLFNKK